MAKREKTDAAASTTLKRRRKKRVTAVDKRVFAFEAELSETKAAHVRLFHFAMQLEANIKKAQAGFQDSRKWLEKVEQKLRIAGN